VLVWSVFSFDRREIALGIFILTEVSLWATLRGAGPFLAESRGSLNDALILIDGAFACISVTLLTLSATIAENKEVRRILEREKATDDIALANIEDALVVTNQQNEIVHTNARTEALLGFTREELLGRDVFDMIVMQNEKGTSIPRAERPLSQVRESGE